MVLGTLLGSHFANFCKVGPFVQSALGRAQGLLATAPSAAGLAGKPFPTNGLLIRLGRQRKSAEAYTVQAEHSARTPVTAGRLLDFCNQLRCYIDNGCL